MVRRGNKRVQNAKKAAVPLIKDVPTLLQKAQESIDRLDWRMALAYLKQALTIEPENITIIDMTAGAMMELGETEDAFPVRLWVLVDEGLIVE